MEARVTEVEAAKGPQVWIISGPSGVGKGTVCAELRRRRPGVFFSVSLTTRAPRPTEIPGVSYHFVDDDTFQRMREAGDLLEYAVVHNKSCYGTPRCPVEEALAEGRTVVLEIDLQGARQVKANLPSAKLIFLDPPSWDELVRRLRGRGTEDEEALARRLDTAERELGARSEADFVVVNDEVGSTAQALIDLMGL